MALADVPVSRLSPARFLFLQRHLKAIHCVTFFRLLLELGLGVWITLVAAGWAGGAGGWLPTYHSSARPEPGDREAFFVLGGALVFLGLLRAVQLLAAARPFPWSRRLGQCLGLLDFLTPLTLPLGLWALLVYRHPDTRQIFSRGLRGDAESAQTR